MERSPQRRIHRLCAARPIGLCRGRPAITTAAPIVAVPFWCRVSLTARDLYACAEAKAHVLLENFDVLKPRNTEGERSLETHFLSVHSIKPRDSTARHIFPEERLPWLFNRRLVGAAV